MDGITLHPCARKAIAIFLLPALSILIVATMGGLPAPLAVLLVTISLAVLGFFFTGIRFIRSGERGLRVTLGVAGTEMSEGVCWTVPMMSQVNVWDTREQTTGIPHFQIVTSNGISVSIECSVQWKRVVGQLKDYFEVAEPDKALIDKIKSSIHTFLGFCHESSDLAHGELKDRMSAFVLRDVRLRCEGVPSSAVGTDWRNVEVVPGGANTLKSWGIEVLSFSVTGYAVPPSVQNAAQAKEVGRIRSSSAETFANAQTQIITSLIKAGVDPDLAPLIAQQAMSPDTKQLPTPGPQVVVATPGGNVGVVGAAAAAATSLPHLDKSLEAKINEES